MILCLLRGAGREGLVLVFLDFPILRPKVSAQEIFMGLEFSGTGTDPGSLPGRSLGSKWEEGVLRLCCFPECGNDWHWPEAVLPNSNCPAPSPETLDSRLSPGIPPSVPTDSLVCVPSPDTQEALAPVPVMV